MRILRGLSSRMLQCGCLAGIYETYDGDVVSILDERAPSCVNLSHEVGDVIPDLTAPGGARPQDASSRVQR